MSFWHLVDYVWIDYFWSSLKGNGPEALLKSVVYAGIAMAVYPPLRKWAQRETGHIHAKLAGITHSHTAIHAKLDALNGVPPHPGAPGSKVLGAHDMGQRGA